ncbi:glucan endo-1,3-beta-glucosidase 14-like [Typha angustifolia]|uniref:glucan endo-1,3-beta-glucosidase 14-like n=1 Tax=Typha angustifolia TaxID=59011 RepID=UPI003C30AE29
MAVDSPIQPLLLALLLFAILPDCLSSTANSSSFLGVNYGQIANNLPSPTSVIPLLRRLGAKHVRLYDADQNVLLAFAGSGVDLTVGLQDSLLPRLADPSFAATWFRSTLLPHLPSTSISVVIVGNEILTTTDSNLIRSLLPAIQSLHSAIDAAGLASRISVTTANSLNVLASSFPPSSAAFRRDLLPYITPLIAFLSKTRSPFLINAYPYFAYKSDPNNIDLNYALFEKNPGVADPGSGIRYENMLHAQIDAVRVAIKKVGGEGIEIRVSETGWPSKGDENEAGATEENARRYNGNLMRLLAEGKGTPAKPEEPIRVYVFALFNENLKPGPASERHYGLFKPDGSPAYDLRFSTTGLASPAGGGNSTAGDGGGGAESPGQYMGASSTGYLSISSAMDKLFWAEKVVPALAVMVGLLLEFA